MKASCACAIGLFITYVAFDNLDIEACIRGMTRKGLPSLRHYPKNRTIEVDIKGTQGTRQLTRCTPQGEGGILSPLVWNLTFDDLLDRFQSGPVQIKGFADNAALLVKGPIPGTLMQFGQDAIEKALAVGKENGLTFGASKTVVVLFNRRHLNTDTLPQLRINQQEIEFSSEAKYLGITLDK